MDIFIPCSRLRVQGVFYFTDTVAASLAILQFNRTKKKIPQPFWFLCLGTVMDVGTQYLRLTPALRHLNIDNIAITPQD
jgi:hypothetical protein